MAPSRLTSALVRWLASLGLVCALAGCGTTRWSDTSRTATEQMLISDAVDRAISQIDFSALAGRDVYLDARFIFGAVDDRYIISTLRQHMLASGCVVKDKLEDANYILEVRTGAVGTNRNDLLFGTPTTQLPSVGGVTPGGATIPEIALFKRTSQQGVCKIAVFAYDRVSGTPVWQSGTRRVDSKSRDAWVLGAGPFQSGSIYEGTKFSGEKFQVPLAKSGSRTEATADQSKKVWVAQEILFSDSEHRVAAAHRSGPEQDAKQASYSQAATPSLLPAPANPIPSFPSNVPPTPQAATARPGSVQSTQQLTNPTAATIGAIQAYDWAKSVRGEAKQQ